MNRGLGFLLIFVVLLIVYLGFLGFILAGVLLLHSFKSTNSTDSFKYKYLKLDHNSEFSAGFGSNEYKCTGKCFCDSTNRKTSLTLLGSLIHLVAASTSVLAIKFAHDYFHDECRSTYSDQDIISCPMENIRSEVDVCQDVLFHDDLLDDYDPTPLEKDIHHVNEEIEKDMIPPSLLEAFYVDQRSFLCSGNCMTNPQIKNRLVFEKNCEEFHDTFRVVDCSLLELKMVFSTVIPQYDTDHFESTDIMVEYLFSAGELNPFCKGQSTFGEVSGCLGIENIDLPLAKGQINPTIRCTEIPRMEQYSNDMVQ